VDQAVVAQVLVDLIQILQEELVILHLLVHLKETLEGMVKIQVITNLVVEVDLELQDLMLHLHQMQVDQVVMV
jgi:hypothetical protein